MKNTSVYSSESVSEGHPDKIADQISDAVLDAILLQDRDARVACETFVSTGLVLVGGEITTTACVDIDTVVRRVIKEIGYDDSDMGFDDKSCAVLLAIGKQSPDIAQGVNKKNEHLGAGDQGIMFGYACNETEVLMPAPIIYAHRLMQRQATLRKEGTLPWLRPDAKSQVTLIYDDNHNPIGVDTVVLSTQHAPDITQGALVEAVIEEIIKPVLPVAWITPQTRYLINPTGRFVIGGPKGDCGMTGRKIIVDTYGGMAHHGGGAFSGKDPSKVDRSAAYAARHIAKMIVAKGWADRCELQLAYAIGVEEPVSMTVESFGTEKIPKDDIIRMIKNTFDLTPRGIINTLQLQRPIYQKTAVYGHFGREDDDFSWEYV